MWEQNILKLKHNLTSNVEDDEVGTPVSSEKKVSFAEGGDPEEQDQAPQLNPEQRFNKLVLGKEINEDEHHVIDVSLDHQ